MHEHEIGIFARQPVDEVQALGLPNSPKSVISLSVSLKAVDYPITRQ